MEWSGDVTLIMFCLNEMSGPRAVSCVTFMSDAGGGECRCGHMSVGTFFQKVAPHKCI